MNTSDNKLTEWKIANALAEYFNYLGQNIIVPNVSWGFFRHTDMEADLLVLRQSGYCEEIEIKISAPDIAADKKKIRHAWGMKSDVPDKIKAKWFCVPEELKDHPDIPDYCGVYYVTKNENGRPKIIKHRTPKLNPRRRTLTEKERLKLLRLAHIRLWSLRTHPRMEQWKNGNQNQ